MTISTPAIIPSSRRQQGMLVTAVVLLAGALYWSTLLPGVGYHPDTARFQFVGKVLGTPHPTGYPLYVLLNHAFVTLVPIGSLALRANLLSALFAATAIGVFFLLLRTLEVRNTVAAAAALLLAATPTLWSQAVVAEVYSLQTLFLCLVLWFVARWHWQRRQRDLMAALAIYALTFTNHMTAITWAPALLFVVAATDWRILLRPRLVAWVFAWSLIALSFYGYVVWRSRDPSAAYLESRASNFDELIRLLTGRRSQHNMFAFSALELVRERVPMFAGLLWRELSWLLAGSVCGIILWRRRKLALFFGLIAFGCLAFGLNYDIPDIFVYFIPVYVVLVLFFGLGLEEISRRLPPRAAGLVALLSLSAPVWSAAHHYAVADQSENRGVARLTERVLETAGSDAVIHTQVRHQIRFFQYYLLGEGRETSQRLYAVFAPERLGAYLRGEEFPLDYEPRQAPPGLALYVLHPDHRDRLREQGFGTLTITRDEMDFYLAFERERGASAIIESLLSRYPESSWFDANAERLYVVPGDPLPGANELPQSNAATQGRIELVAKIRVRQREVTISADEPLLVEGWAIDTARGLPAGGVMVELDGARFPAAYGIARPDQAARLGDQRLMLCGFRAVIPARALIPGPHELRLSVLSHDRKAWHATPRPVILVGEQGVHP